MKYAKRFASLLLALVMVLGLSVTAFATGTDTPTGSITVDNPQKEENGDYLTYTAYKIFDVVYDIKDGKAGEHYAYTIKSDSKWFETVATYALPTSTTYSANQPSYTGANGLTLTQSASDPTVYVVETDSTGSNKFSAPDFAKALQSALKTPSLAPTGKPLTVGADNKATVSDLELGYYFVTSTDGALANLTTANPSVTIYDKNDRPFDKVDNQESVDVGQTVNYTITGKVPDTTGFTSYTYLITDSMSDGLTFKKDVVVTIGDTTVTPREITDEKATLTGNQIRYKDNGFELSINVMTNNTSIVTKKIKVTYSAVVNENAVAQIEKNHAVLTYSNDPTSNTTAESKPQEETVYSAKIVIDKYAKNATNEGDKSTKLAGAEFVLYKRGESTTTQPETGDYDTVVSGDVTTYYPRTYYKYTAATTTEGAKVEWVAGRNDATAKITDKSGAASFDGLADGTYYLLETEAPTGYNLLTAPVPVTVNGANAKATDLSALTQTASVANNTGSLLPSTGGIGTTIFYVIGGVLVIGAVVLLVVRRRMRAEK